MTDQQKDRLMACPFCGSPMIPKWIVGVTHPRNDCFLSAMFVPVDRYPKWNRRASDTSPGGATPDVVIEKLPCDVRLPPSTMIGKGCPISTLMTALKMRVGKDAVFR